jgi:hypothetical protein
MKRVKFYIAQEFLFGPETNSEILFFLNLPRGKCNYGIYYDADNFMPLTILHVTFTPD